MGWMIGELTLAIEAYFLRDHIALQLLSHAPMLLVPIVILCGIPESTRWLISKKMYNQATKQVLNIAKINQTNVPENLLKSNIAPDTIELSTSNKNVSSTAGKYCTPF
jgi:hypothetical protein